MGWAGNEIANIIADAMMNGTKQIEMPDGQVLNLPPVQKTWRKFKRESYCNRKAIELYDKWMNNEKL